MRQFIINNVLDEKRKIHASRTRKISKKIIDKIILNTNFLSSDSVLVERIYCIYHKIDKQKMCIICNNKKVSFKNFNTGYKKYCSAKCGNRDPEIIKKKKEKSIKKYGVTCPLLAEKIKKKTKQTNLKKYGHEDVRKSEIFKNKVKNKWKNKSVNDMLEIQEKTKLSNLKKYGVTSTNKLFDVKDKKKQSYLKKYGVENPSQSKEIQDKIKQTNLKNMG